MPKATPAARPTATPARSERPDAPKRQGAATRITLLLFATLLLVGLAVVGAQGILQRALSAPSPSTLADRICADYRTQNYTDLTDQIDPAPTTPDAGPFSAAATRTQLISLDRIQGQVTRCDPGQVAQSSSTTDRAQALLVMQRQRQNAPVTLLIVMRQETDGSWKLSRETNLTPGL
jgi:hypothetical protein